MLSYRLFIFSTTAIDFSTERKKIYDKIREFFLFETCINSYNGFSIVLKEDLVKISRHYYPK